MNNKEFAIRLKKIMEYYQLSASGFADRIKVPRSSISHLLSGRNKPSLDFVLKVVQEFDTVDLYWLLYEKGLFPNDNSSSPSLNIPSVEINPEKEKPLSKLQKDISNNSKDIEKIVMFYSDGTFKEYIK